MSDAALDGRVRVRLYEHTLETGSLPLASQLAEALGTPQSDIDAALRRLADAHLIVLDPATAEVRMANPLSAVPTDFRVETPRGSFFGNCVWDGLGVAAMLGGDGTVRTSCPDCGEPMALQVSDGGLAPSDTMVHFAVPARHWWDDIIYA